ncbi:MAG: soluble lytic murein transglycosylase [Acidobacteriota bacterium]|nr:soluble lytic murein transglycosylase [Acidobacteriota bacterium]
MRAAKRLALIALFLSIVAAVGLYFFNQFWIHRFDEVIARQSRIYRVDPLLVWSIAYEETYFRPWKRGDAGEIGLMQVTPPVAREWADETGMKDMARAMERDPVAVLSDPERNIQVGCWYLEKISKDYRDTPDAEARILAAYNAGPSRAVEWNRTAPNRPPLTGNEFIARIDFPTTRSYVTSILARYRKLQAERAARDGGKR